jgi:hypothetical protein
LAGLSLKDRLPERATSLLVVTGTTAGLAVWTKNEGWLVLVSVVPARASVLGRIQSWASWRRELPAFVAGLAPVLLVVLYFKLTLAPPNDLVSNLGWHETVPRLLAPREISRGDTGIQPWLRSGEHAAKKARKTALGQSCSRRSPAELLRCPARAFDVVR